MKELSNVDLKCNLKKTQNAADLILFKIVSRNKQHRQQSCPNSYLTKCKLEPLCKPWLTQGIRKSITAKEPVSFIKGEKEKHVYYKNKILTPIRISKSQYYKHVFEKNRTNCRKTWATINYIAQKERKFTIKPYFP